MSNRIRVAIILLLQLTFLNCEACNNKPQEGGSDLKVAILFSPSGKGDRSYNDVALKGIEEAKGSILFNLSETQPPRVADYETVLHNLAAGGTNLIIGVGFLYTDSIKKVALDFPQTKFVVVDGDAGELSNVRSLVFRPEEGCFLVGAIAALKSQTKHIGFITGMDIPIMHRFQCGYVEGARYIDESIVIEERYIGSTPDAFSDPAKGKDIALLMYDKGVDIIFHAAGASGNGVIQAAKEKNKFVIGVDTDQSYQAPEWVITSMIKRIDSSVAQAIQDVSEQKFSGGVQDLGLKEGGVDYVINETGPSHISPETKSRVEQLRNDIVSGKIQVCKQG